MPTSPRPITHAAAASRPDIGIIGRSAYCTLCRRRHKTHRLRNVLAKLPERPGLHERVKQAYWSTLGEAASSAEAEAGLRALVGVLAADGFASAAACLADDLPALTVHLAYPLRLRTRLRSTNLLERSLGEVRRRTKVIGRFPGETSCLTLAWAVMDLVIAAAHGLGLTLPERQLIATMVTEREAPRLERQVAYPIPAEEPVSSALLQRDSDATSPSCGHGYTTRQPLARSQGHRHVGLV